MFDFDPAKAKMIFEEVDGLVAVEAEHYAEQTLTNVRKWYLTTTEPKLEIPTGASPAEKPYTRR